MQLSYHCIQSTTLPVSVPATHPSVHLRLCQSTNSGFGHVSQENVFKVCDQPHPHKLRAAVQKAREGNTQDALDVVMALWQVC